MVKTLVIPLGGDRSSKKEELHEPPPGWHGGVRQSYPLFRVVVVKSIRDVSHHD